MFLQASVISVHGGGGDLPQCMLEYHTPWEQTPLDQTPPGSRHPPGADTPQEADTSIRSMSGWYASYWNAFLFLSKMTRSIISVHILSIGVYEKKYIFNHK